jgi:DNA polymerase-3 subunit alpha
MYSILDGMSTPEEVIERAKEIGVNAVAVTDHGSQFGWYYFAKLQSKYPNIKIIYGIEAYEAFDMNIKDKDSKYFHLIILAQNNNGLKAINEIITKSNFEGFYYKPRIDINLLKPYAKDLVISSACLASKLSREEDYNKCIHYINEYKAIFPYFYLEMQVHKSLQQIEYNKKILKLSQDTNTPFIITNDSHYTTKDMEKAHSYFININRNNEDIYNTEEVYEDCYMHSQQEIYDIMTPQIGCDNVKLGLDNTNIIANMCDAKIEFSEPQLPHINIPKQYKSEEEYFKHLIYQGYKKRGYHLLPESQQKVYKDRVKHEFDTIKKMNYIGYHLIIRDFINYAKEQGIPVAPGRGSSAGCLINSLIDITDIDPIPYNLLFERYLNPDRVTMPDVDSDFSSDRRNEVFKYIQTVYGEPNVAQIINFSYITPKVAIKDSGRVLGTDYIPLKNVNEIAEFMTQDTIEESYELYSKKSQKLVEYKEQYPELFNLACKLQNRVRNISTNACGTVISSKPISEYCGMFIGKDGQHLLQVDKIIVEELGMVKCDVLGTEVLKIIKDVMELNGQKYENIKNIPLDDKDTYDFLAKGKLYGVFQLEGYNMTKFFSKLKPQNIEDITAGISMYRPGSMQYLDDYIERKEDNSKIIYDHPLLENSLKTTYGITVYQEQVQQVLRDLAGFTYARADLVRRGMAKKKIQYVLAEKNNFIYGNKELNIKGCVNNNIPEETAIKIWNDLEQFAAYGFNKSHGLAYALLTYYTAYLKCHYPLKYMTILLSSNKNDYSDIAMYLKQCRDMNLSIAPPDINISEKNFSIQNGIIYFGLSKLYNVGEEIINQIIRYRPYKSFDEFLDINFLNIKNDDIKIDKSALLSLINSGCFDNMGYERKQLLLKVFYYLVSKINQLSTTQINEIFDNPDIDLKEFQNEQEIYNLHKFITKCKYKCNICDEEVNTIIKYYSDCINQEDNLLIIDKKKYDKKYKAYLENIKKYFKDNEQSLIENINKARIINMYTENVKNSSESDLEFESTSFYFNSSWLNDAVIKYGADEFDNIPEIEVNDSNRYKKKQLYSIVGTLLSKEKKHKEFFILSNKQIIIVKCGDILYNNYSSNLGRGSKLIISGYRANGYFYAEYYENGRSNKLNALKVL